MAFRFLWSSELGDALVIGPEDLLLARPPLGVGDVPVAGDRGHLADLEDRARNLGIAIAVDDEPGIDLRDEGGVEAVGEEIRRAGDADIPGDVALEVAVMEPEPSEPPGNSPTGMVTGNEEGRGRILIGDGDRMGFAGGEQLYFFDHAYDPRDESGN